MSEVVTLHQARRELEDHNVHCKLTLCCLRTQNGKTFVAIEKIRRTLMEERENREKRSVHFIFTMNTIKANGQVSARLKSIEQEFGNGSVCILNSNKKYLGRYRHVTSINEINTLFTDMRYINERPRVIIVCGNPKRFRDARDFMDCLNTNCTSGEREIRAFLYADEFHDKKVNTAENRRILEEIHEMPVVRNIMLLSATPKRIFRKQGIWKHLRMIDLRTFDPNPKYRGISHLVLSALEIDAETEKNILDLCPDHIPADILTMAGYKGNKNPKFKKEERIVIGYIHYILEQHPEYLQAGNRIFLPAHVRKYTHYYIRKMIEQMNPSSAFILTNGDEKTLEISSPEGKRTVQLTANRRVLIDADLSDDEEDFTEENLDEELSETLARFYVKYNLQNYPLFFSGFYLVSMGQTLLHEVYGPFTHMIASHLDLDNDDIYQLLGRGTARMGKKITSANGEDEWIDWSTLCETIIHCPTLTYNRAKAMEECARNMAMFSDELVTKEDYEAPLHLIDDGAYLEQENTATEREAKGHTAAPNCIGSMAKFKTLQELLIHYNQLESSIGGKFTGEKITDPERFVRGFQKTPDKQFYKCAIGQKSAIQTTRDVDAYARKCSSMVVSKSVTSGLGANAIALKKEGDMIHRVYIAYDNTSDKTTIHYYLRWVKRVN